MCESFFPRSSLDQGCQTARGTPSARLHVPGLLLALLNAVTLVVSRGCSSAFHMLAFIFTLFLSYFSPEDSQSDFLVGKPILWEEAINLILSSKSAFPRISAALFFTEADLKISVVCRCHAMYTSEIRDGTCCRSNLKAFINGHCLLRNTCQFP